MKGIFWLLLFGAGAYFLLRDQGVKQTANAANGLPKVTGSSKGATVPYPNKPNTFNRDPNVVYDRDDPADGATI